MYNTSADDLARIAGDLSTLATTYTNSAQQLDQEVTSLDGTASQLINGGPERWVGQSSEAFLGAWGERKARMQQASQILTQSAQYLKQLAQTIDEQLPTIRADQSLMGTSAYNSLAGPDQQSILNEDSQAQNAIITALSTLNSQLESLAEEIGDCPQEHQDSNTPGSGDPMYNKSDSGSGSGDNGGGSNQGGDQGNTPVPLPNADQAQIDPAKFENYSMDPNNTNNNGKWKAFQALGYDVNTPEGRAAGAQDVINQLKNELPDHPATQGASTPFGQRYEVDSLIQGPNGKEGTLVTIWQYDSGSTTPRLITNWLQVH